MYMADLSFQQIMENFTKTSAIGFYIIHLERAKERLPVIEELEKKLNIKLQIFEGADGYKLIGEGHPITCQQRGPPATRGPGDIGCTVSHINICKDALSKNYEHIVIFEDDCVFTSDLFAVAASLEQVNMPWDLLLLGGNPKNALHISGTSVSKVTDFDCTHACVLNSKFMRELVNTYQSYYDSHCTLSIDTMYSNVLKTNKVTGIILNRRPFIQKPAMYSYIVERIR